MGWTLLALLALLAGCERNAQDTSTPPSESDELAHDLPDEELRPMGVEELIFGLPLPEGAEPIVYQPALRTFSHPAPLDELHAFFEREIPLASRQVLDRGVRYARPDSDPAVFVYRDPRPGGASRLAYVPVEQHHDQQARTQAIPGADDGPSGPTRIVMPDSPHPAIADQPAARQPSGPLTPAQRQQLREQSAYRGPEDYITGREAFAPPGYLQPGTRRGMTSPPRRAHPAEFGGQRQPGSRNQPSRFVPANPGAEF